MTEDEFIKMYMAAKRRHEAETKRNGTRPKIGLDVRTWFGLVALVTALIGSVWAVTELLLWTRADQAAYEKTITGESGVLTLHKAKPAHPQQLNTNDRILEKQKAMSRKVDNINENVIRIGEWWNVQKLRRPDPADGD